MGKILLVLALALVLAVELLYLMITAAAATPTKMKDLLITTNLPCLMVIQKCSLGGRPRCIMGMDDELWDILEEGVGDLRLDEEGVALDRKAHTTEQKKIYKKHHTIRGILVATLPHKEYLKMSDKSTTKAMFTSLCANYEGNKKVREVKATMLVHQYELFRMKMKQR